MMASWCHGKSGKQIERCVIATFRIAESLGFKGDCRQWRIYCESEIDHGKLSRLIPSVAGERHQTVRISAVPTCS